MHEHVLHDGNSYKIKPPNDTVNILFVMIPLEDGNQQSNIL